MRAETCNLLGRRRSPGRRLIARLTSPVIPAEFSWIRARQLRTCFGGQRGVKVRPAATATPLGRQPKQRWGVPRGEFPRVVARSAKAQAVPREQRHIGKIMKIAQVASLME